MVYKFFVSFPQCGIGSFVDSILRRWKQSSERQHGVVLKSVGSSNHILLRVLSSDLSALTPR